MSPLGSPFKSKTRAPASANAAMTSFPSTPKSSKSLGGNFFRSLSRSSFSSTSISSLASTCSMSSTGSNYSRRHARSLSSRPRCSIGSFGGSGNGGFRMQDWMYWKREDSGCWTKVWVVNENEFVWVYQSDSKRPDCLLIQLAVAQVTVTKINSFLLEDVHGATMELFLYEQERFTEWQYAFMEAMQLLNSHFARNSIDAADLPRNSCYRGSLHEYHKEKETHRHKRSLSRKWSSFWNKHLERFVEFLDKDAATK